MTFEELGLPAEVLKVLEGLGFATPTPIQEKTIPALLRGEDVLGQAATGTGKTAAFGLPLVARLKPGAGKMFEAQALVLVPTRELALQVTEALQSFGGSLGFNVVPVYGGEPIGGQLRLLKRGADVVVGTPGRVLDHLKRMSLILKHTKAVVLDEADEMLDMGFAEDLEMILDGVPEGAQSALFSATMPPRIQKIAERHLKSPVRVTIAKAVPKHGEAPKVRLSAYVVPHKLKEQALCRVLELENPQSALVFCRTRADVDELAAVLPDRGFPAEALHGGLDQTQRDRVMKKFKSGAVRLLVATDVAARGLDIENLSHVVNYDVPTSPEVFVHRIGRTGRAGREGVALTLVDPKEVRLIRGLEKAAHAKLNLEKVPTRQQIHGKQLEDVRKRVVEAASTGTGAEAKEWISAQPDVAAFAAAALELLHQKLFPPPPEGEVDVPEYAPKSHGAAATGKGHERAPRGEKPQGAPRPARKKDYPVAALFIAAGSKAGIRPGDLVGMIANEAGIHSQHIGPIEISENHSLVGVPEEIADEIVDALRSTTLRGRRVQVRRDNS